jgi:hypothetical protein
MPLQLPARTVTVFWYLATGLVDESLEETALGALGGQEDGDDLGELIELVALSNEYAPAGIGGEAIFTNVYITLLRSNTEELTLLLTPYVDGAAEDEIEIVRPATLVPIREILEVGLARYYPSAADPQIATAMRGTWFQADLRTPAIESVATMPGGRLIIEGWELESEVVTEGKAAVNASA